MEDTLVLTNIFTTLKKRAGLIIVLSLLGLGLMMAYTMIFVTPQFTASTQLLVNRTTSEITGVEVNDIDKDIKMINTYKDIIKGPVILDQVRKELNIPLTPDQLAGKIVIQTEENSQVFSINVTDEDPYASARLANKVAATFRNEIGTIMKVDNVTIISKAVPKSTPISPNIPMNAVAGLIIGLMMGIGITFLIELADKTIQSDSYITDKVEWTILGSVYEMTLEETNPEMKTKEMNLNLQRVNSKE
ncbi:YveK family protein [Carnobacterium funditum]|uniref:YveK family protein n=1 Tax=Carnobacterium funditum TaxID=2752 RepID=UPI0005501DBD|nr:Wzz/FepE/Etk N-terminal domain-containing protein [Carnobacterium funditum]